MRDGKRLLLVGIVAGFLLCTFSCASVPKEVVELSYRTGQDIEQMQLSEDLLIHAYFDQLRETRISFLEDEWAPAFIAKWIRNGKLVELAKGELIWSEESGTFVQPSLSHGEEQLHSSVGSWAEEATLHIEEKRDSLLAPLDREEMQLRNDVAVEFRQLIRSNAVITAHLNSLRQVQEVQDQGLQALGVKDLRDRIDSVLVSASDRAAVWLEKAKDADSLLQTVKKL